MRVCCWALVIASALTLSGCAAVWGKSYKVEFASPSSITINFDPSLTNMGEIQSVAQQHCDQYGKDALPQTKDDSAWGLRTISFVCQARS